MTERPAIVAKLSNRGRLFSGMREVPLKRFFTSVFPVRHRAAVPVALLLLAAEAVARASNGAAPTSDIPTLGGIGLATLAGGLAMAGAWAMSRSRRKK